MSEKEKYYTPQEVNARYKTLATRCIVCGESVPLDDYEARLPHVVKVCDKCKKAIMKMRKELEK